MNNDPQQHVRDMAAATSDLTLASPPLPSKSSVKTRPPHEHRRLVRVTVILPSYNFDAFIGQAIHSVQSQSMSDWELLIFDNGSTDNSHAVIGDFIRDERIFFQINESNLGLFGSVQRGIDAARGNYFVILGADDILEPEFLEHAVSILDSDATLSLVHGAAIWIDEQGAPYGGTNDAWLARNACRQAFQDVFRLGFCLTTVVARTNLVRQMPAFNSTWNVMNDVWLMLRMALIGDLAYMHSPLVQYRVHAKSLSVTGYRTGDFFLQQLRITQEAFDWPESRALGLHSGKGGAMRHVALESIRILHVTRLATSRWYYFLSLGRIVRRVPSVLIYPEVWLRVAFAMLPCSWIKIISDWKRDRWRKQKRVSRSDTTEKRNFAL